MTAVGYADIFVDSPSGRYRAEARSPDNGTIHQRDGSPPDPNSFGYQYRQEQRSFRYQLIDLQTKQVVWERWQAERETSPFDLMVSDTGWLVIRTNGYSFASLICMAPSGENRITVEIGAPRPEGDHPGNAPRTKNVVEDDHIATSTAGIFWTIGSFHYFFQYEDRTHLVYMLGWGRRVVIDLDGGKLLKDVDVSSSLLAACEANERRQSLNYLAKAASELEDYDGNELFGGTKEKTPYWERWPYLKAHLATVIRQQLVDAIPSLQAMEPIAMQAGYSGCNALPRNHWVFEYSFRPLLALALRHLGVVPQGYHCYGFFRFEFQVFQDTKNRVLPVPECVSNRDALTSQIDDKMTSGDVLSVLGAPDRIQSFSVEYARIHKWGENWDYYVGVSNKLAALRIVWQEGSDGSKMAMLETVPLTHELVCKRIYEILDL